MRAVIQRVKNARLSVDGELISKIDRGLVVFLGFEENDTATHFEWLANKIAGLRIFEDENGKMNLPLSSVNGQVLVISNFTLYGNCYRGFRPSFIAAMRPENAKLMYDNFVRTLSVYLPGLVKQGIFGADMQVEQTNDGPITLFLDTAEYENTKK